MKTAILSLFFLCFGIITTNAQISEKQLKSFIPKGYTIKSSSGDGLKKYSGDILLELVSAEKEENETLSIIRNENGKLKKFTENKNLLMGKEMLGNSGGTSSSLIGNILLANYSLGSNSAYSNISIQFEKGKDGQYYFKQYTAQTQNYGVENLFARQRITAVQTGKILFANADEEIILRKGNLLPTNNDSRNSPLDAAKKFKQYIPEGFQVAAFAEGYLNEDAHKKDVVLWLYNEDKCSIMLLLEQANGQYKTATANNVLMKRDDYFNSHNVRVVVKNGYFTLEQRMATDKNDFNHRYITFHYDKNQRNWMLHRYDVEHYAGFNDKPVGTSVNLTRQNFGTIAFNKMQHIPGEFYYEPALSTIRGAIIKKQFYGRPNYGETPEKDEKIWVYILKTDFPISVIANPNQAGEEMADETIMGISEMQVYSLNRQIDLSKFLNKNVALKGLLISGFTSRQYTKVLMQVKEIVN